MKHIRGISKGLPARGAIWQDAVCVVATAKSNIVTALGGTLPIATTIDDKCAFKPPTDGTTGTTGTTP